MPNTQVTNDLPVSFTEEDAIEEFMTRPSKVLIDDLAELEGDIMILGVGGKMGPTLARLAKRAAPVSYTHLTLPTSDLV